MSGKPTRPLITLLTDFGLKDHFAGVLKGVIASIAPETRVIDISHEVEPYGVTQAQFLLSQSWPYFPQGTIHLAIVDPGVGGARRPIFVEAYGHRFVGPDNGVFGDLMTAPTAKVRMIANSGLFLPDVSATFHGRDVFAPVCAHLSLGVAASSVGPLIRDAVRRTAGQAVQTSATAWTGEIIHVDRFGNLITNLSLNCITAKGHFVLKVASYELRDQAASYSDILRGQAAVVAGSSGFLEIAANQDSAARLLGLGVGARTELNLE